MVSATPQVLTHFLKNALAFYIILFYLSFGGRVLLCIPDFLETPYCSSSPRKIQHSPVWPQIEDAPALRTQVL